VPADAGRTPWPFLVAIGPARLHSALAANPKRPSMKVYEIGIGVEVPHGKGARQVLTTVECCDQKDIRIFLNNFAGTPYTRKWKPVRFYVDKPKLPRPDFFMQTRGWICNERAMLLAGEAMEMAGESLPVEIEGETGQFAFFHITNCINVLDPEKSEWEVLGPVKGYKSLESYTARQLKRPAFRPERFGEESLFKIPEDYGIRSYCLERSGDPDDGEFKAVVEHHKLTGLTFDLIWSDAGTRRKNR
jgi:hypothetical protein